MSDFKESEHSRKDNGQFGTGGGSSGPAPVSVHITGNELGAGLSTKELRQAATNYAEKNFAGKEYRNENSGAAILVTRQGIKHGLANANDIEIRLMPALPRMLERAKYTGSEPDKSGRAEIKAAHKYVTTAKVGEETLTVGIVVRELADGHRYYDHFAIKNAPAGTSGVASHDGKLGTPAFNGGASIVWDCRSDFKRFLDSVRTPAPRSLPAHAADSARTDNFVTRYLRQMQP